jgi:hypothetical protein
MNRTTTRRWKVAEEASVRYTSALEAVCDEAAAYTITDGEGNEKDTTLLAEGDVISGIPEGELHRWLLNSSFEAQGEVPQEVEERKEAAGRVSGREVEAEPTEATEPTGSSSAQASGAEEGGEG